jgi:hypothetical protein
LSEEQERKYQEIIELLLAGGYFRARIQGLSQFDKVVGGMSWCITASNEDVDIDLLEFQGLKHERDEANRKKKRGWSSCNMSRTSTYI